MKARQGQPEFRRALREAYAGKCAITGCTVEPALEAAHIQSYSEEGESRVNNGLLLRAGIHSLFDFHYIAVDPDQGMRILVHAELVTSYPELIDQHLVSPTAPQNHPDPALLCEHLRRFKLKSV